MEVLYSVSYTRSRPYTPLADTILQNTSFPSSIECAPITPVVLNIQYQWALTLENRTLHLNYHLSKALGCLWIFSLAPSAWFHTAKVILKSVILL